MPWTARVAGPGHGWWDLLKMPNTKVTKRDPGGSHAPQNRAVHSRGALAEPDDLLSTPFMKS
eukprot:1041920-Amphidinium_carterae.1